MPHQQIIEDGIVAGNCYDKYSSSNPLVKWMMGGFWSKVEELLAIAGATDIHEVGCGEGHLTCRVAQKGYQVRATDFSTQVIDIACEQSKAQGVGVCFEARSIYDLDPDRDAAELIMCCEVLEHLPHVPEALDILTSLAKPYLLVSVPREPLWRMLNCARGKYLASLGNTPGHINHWSRKSFLQLLHSRFRIIEVRNPFPWTMALCCVN